MGLNSRLPRDADVVTYYSGHPTLSTIEDGRLRVVGAELVFFFKDLSKLHFSIPLNQIQTVKVELHTLTPGQLRGVKAMDALGYQPSLLLGTQDSLHIHYADEELRKHALHFVSNNDFFTKNNNAEALRLMIESALGNPRGGRLRHFGLYYDAISNFPQLHSFYRFNISWDLKIATLLVIAGIAAFVLCRAIPK